MQMKCPPAGDPWMPSGQGAGASLPLCQLPCVSVLHQNQCCIRLHEGHLGLQCAGPASLSDLHCGPAHQEVPNPVPGGCVVGEEVGRGIAPHLIILSLASSFLHLLIPSSSASLSPSLFLSIEQLPLARPPAGRGRKSQWRQM